MNDFQKAKAEFERYCVSTYNCFPEQVWDMVDREVNRLLSGCTVRKTAKQIEAIQQSALANCREWLSEERIELKASHIYRWCPAKCYFTALTKKD